MRVWKFLRMRLQPQKQMMNAASCPDSRCSGRPYCLTCILKRRIAQRAVEIGRSPASFTSGGVATMEANDNAIFMDKLDGARTFAEPTDETPFL